jgi:DNA-binding beta-propeller fold protein YncE
VLALPIALALAVAVARGDDIGKSRAAVKPVIEGPAPGGDRTPGAGRYQRPQRVAPAERADAAERTPNPGVREVLGATANLRTGSNPGVLPGPVLIADRDNNRLLEVSPQGRVLWRFPKPGDLAPGQTFLAPDDAFFTPSGQQIVATQEEDFAISVVGVTRRRILYRYGHAGVPGSAPNYLDNPDDAMLAPAGDLILADIKNCRVLVIRPPAHHPLRQLGVTGDCEHGRGSYGSPNGAFPMAGGDTVITEINGDWVDVVSPSGRSVSATHPPGFSYPSDTNEVRPGVFLTADYTDPGALESFTANGRLRWRYEPRGAAALDHPSLALPLPNGDILANDDQNDRVIVVDPRTNKIVWQYGHMHIPGSGEGFLSNPDGVDLAPPYSLTQRFAASMRAP